MAQIKNEKLLKKYRGVHKCELCGRVSDCVAHHHLSKMRGGGRLDVEENISSLCPTCHTRIHSSPNQVDRLHGEGTYQSFHKAKNGMSRQELEDIYEVIEGVNNEN